MSETTEERSRPDETGWGRAYGSVLCFFALEILFLYLFTVRFS
jgi:hypothetical protein